MDHILTLLLQMSLMKHSAKDAVAPEKLAPAIYKVSQEYEVDPELIVKIIIVESKGRAHARNKRTGDLGLMQINPTTAWLYGFKESCLLDWRCNLGAGIEILSDMQAHKHYRPCMYNVGPHFETKQKKCLTYEAALDRVR